MIDAAQQSRGFWQSRVCGHVREVLAGIYRWVNSSDVVGGSLFFFPSLRCRVLFAVAGRLVLMWMMARGCLGGLRPPPSLSLYQVIAYKQRLEADECRRKAMDKHLVFLVKQTERYRYSLRLADGVRRCCLLRAREVQSIRYFPRF